MSYGSPWQLTLHESAGELLSMLMGVKPHDQGNSQLTIQEINVQGYTVVLLLNTIVQRLTQYGTCTCDSDEEPGVSGG